MCVKYSNIALKTIPSPKNDTRLCYICFRTPNFAGLSHADNSYMTIVALRVFFEAEWQLHASAGLGFTLRNHSLRRKAVKMFLRSIPTDLRDFAHHLGYVCFCLVFALRSSMQLLGTIIEHHCHAHFILLHGGVYPAI